MELYINPLNLNKSDGSFLSSSYEHTNLYRQKRKLITIHSMDCSSKYLQIFWFQIYRCHLWHSVSTFHEKINFSHISVNAFSLIPVTVYTTCNKQNMQRPRCSREQLLQSHPGTAAPWPGTATWEGVTNMALLSLTECSHQAVGLLPAELWSGWAPVEAPHLKLLFTPRHS